MGRKRKQHGRDISGVLVLNKPAGITSNDALQKVKRLFDARKAGHTGTLDKPAIGMLPVCFGEATKFTTYLLNADKHYVALCRLGIETVTGDAEGEVRLEKRVPRLSERALKKVLLSFTGEIQQVPPMHSALKHRGKPLYKLAYQGVEVEREPRTVMIHRIGLDFLEGEQFQINVHCSKGTYVRTLVQDIGRKLGCGAHISRLERTGVGDIPARHMISLERLQALSAEGPPRLDEILLPVDSIIREMPEVTLEKSVSRYLENGQAVIVPHAPTEGLLRIYNENHDFLGIGEVLDDGRVAPRRLVNLPSG